jgi:hypothetical protein
LAGWEVVLRPGSDGLRGGRLDRLAGHLAFSDAVSGRDRAGPPVVAGLWRVVVLGWSGGVELDLDADGVGDDDRVSDVGGPGGGAGHAGSASGPLVIGADVAALEDAGDLVLGSAAPGQAAVAFRSDALAGEGLLYAYGVSDPIRW